jgi:hypothetical protein
MHRFMGSHHQLVFKFISWKVWSGPQSISFEVQSSIISLPSRSDINNVVQPVGGLSAIAMLWPLSFRLLQNGEAQALFLPTVSAHLLRTYMYSKKRRPTTDN